MLEPEGPVDPGILRDSSSAIKRVPHLPVVELSGGAAGLAHGQPDLGGAAGLVQVEVDAASGEACPVLCLAGCSGNISYTSSLDGTGVGRISSAVMAAYLETSGDPIGSLGAAAEQVILPVPRLQPVSGASPISQLKVPELAGAINGKCELLQEEDAIAIPTTVQVFRLGWYALVGLPGTPLSRLALNVKSGISGFADHWWPGTEVMLATSLPGRPSR